MRNKNIRFGLPAGTILKGNYSSYRIVESLGQGTFGITYLAEILNDSGLDSGMLVCVKEFFMRDINGRNGTEVKCSSERGIFENYRDKFEREARNLESIKDDNIVRVVESFRGNNTVYYAMSFISGGSLDELIDTLGRIDEKEALCIASTLAYALERLHRQGMAHLDMKPSNVMMMGGKMPVIIDFGLAKHFNADGQPETSTTVGAGTPGYAPIEQSHYHGKDSNPWPMDVYALGGTMYKMLTGKRPPSAPDIYNDGFPEGDLKSLGISDRTIEIVRKSMAPMKTDRYATADEMQQEIDRHIADFNSAQSYSENTEYASSSTDYASVNAPHNSSYSSSYHSDDYYNNNHGNNGGGNNNGNNQQPRYANVYDNPMANYFPPKQPKDNRVRNWIMTIVIAIVVACGVFFGLGYFINGSHSASSEQTEDSANTSDLEPKADITASGEYRLIQMVGTDMPSSLDLTVDKGKVTGEWHNRVGDIKFKGVYTDNCFQLRSTTTSMRLFLRDNGDNTLEGTLSGGGREESIVKFEYVK